MEDKRNPNKQSDRQQQKFDPNQPRQPKDLEPQYEEKGAQQVPSDPRDIKQ